MRKLLIASVLMLSAIASVYAQQTAAPDQGDASVSSSSAASAAPASSEAAEKEVVATAGIIYNDGRTDYASTNSQFIINTKDDGAGVKATYVMVDEAAFTNYDAPLAFGTEGKHSIVWKVEDNVGNISPFKYYEFILDITAPVASINSDRKAVKINDTLYVGSNFNFGIYAQDALSGVKNIEYSIDEGAAAVFSAPFAPIGTNGIHKVEYTATDNVGNVSEKASYVFFMDINAPTLEFAVKGAAFDANGVKFIAPNATVEITAADAETGVDRITYTVDGGAETGYAYGLKLSAGAHTIKAKAYDLLGNVSEEKEFSVTVDGALPEGDLVPAKK